MMILIFLAVFLPLISAVSTLFFAFKKPNDIVKFGSTAMLTVAAICSFFVFKDVVIDKNFYKIFLFDFIKVFNFESKFTIRLDSLSASMILLVNFVSACVHFYSISYMDGDRAINRFFTYLSMFTFFMIILVLSDDLVQLFLGWEGVGVSSFALISFWFKKDSASAAANKAFIVNRVGDFALVIGIGLCYFVFQTINLTEISKIYSQYIDHQISFLGFQFLSINLICFFVFIGCMGKSAQLGLHVWLPDAMEGPTPVSALIHAATMVTAGVFLVVRMFYLFEISDVKGLILIIAGLTSVFAASVSCFQTDIKKIIAYSTCSQLGYMFMACGASGYNAGVFHLLTHGFFKALLFLGAGSIIHATNEQNINKLPPLLFKIMPYTFVLMIIGTLAITGIPPFSGFYSKDAIIEHLINLKSYAGLSGAELKAEHSRPFFSGFSQMFGYVCALLTVFITAFYSWKLIFKSFFNFGSLSDASNSESSAHESGFFILLPMIFLSIFAFSSGFLLQNSLKILDHANSYWGGSLISKEIHHHNIANIFLKNLPLIISISGAFVAYYLFMFRQKNNEVTEMIEKENEALSFKKILKNKFYFDEIYDYVFVKNLKRFACISSFFDKEIFDKIFVNGFRSLVYFFGRKSSFFHGGLLYRYGLWQITGVLIVIIYIFFKR